MKKKSVTILLNMFVFAVIAGVFSDQPSRTFSAQVSDDDILATVNDQPITTGEVERDIARSLSGIKLTDVQMSKAKEVSLEKLVDQVIVLDFLMQKKILATADEVRLKLESLESKLASVEKNMVDHLKKTNQTLAELKRETRWQISWQRYLNRQLTDAFLETYFKKNSRRYDGTEIRVAHLLLKSDAKSAEKYAQQLAANPSGWNEWVANYSDAPSKQNGGEIGWIKFDGVMPPAFTAAAFELSGGDISPPVKTKFGTHIIKCLEVKPGKKGWRDAAEAVKKDARRDLFRTIATQHRSNVKIKYHR